MKQMPSSEYRRSFASLTEPVAVTVHGHVIGTWTPTKIAYADTWSTALPSGADAPGVKYVVLPRFTPVPKPSKRR